MKTASLKITDPVGIHARPASKIVAAAARFSSEIKLKSGAKVANAKSIMNLMSLGLGHGSEVELSCSGPDEETAIKTLVQVMADEGLAS